MAETPNTKATAPQAAAGGKKPRWQRYLRGFAAYLLLQYAAIVVVSLLNFTPPGQKRDVNAGAPECAEHIGSLSAAMMRYRDEHKRPPRAIRDLRPYVKDYSALCCVRGTERPYDIVTLPDGSEGVRCRWHWFVVSSEVYAILRDIRTYYPHSLILCPDGNVRIAGDRRPILRCLRPIMFREAPPDRYDAEAYEILKRLRPTLSVIPVGPVIWPRPAIQCAPTSSGMPARHGVWSVATPHRKSDESFVLMARGRVPELADAPR
jgi:hypothetical protein